MTTTKQAGEQSTYRKRAAELTTTWIVQRKDGVTHRFTQHDQYLSTVLFRLFSPLPGVRASATRKVTGLNAHTTELFGLIDDGSITVGTPGITYADLYERRLDEATVRRNVVNWAFPWMSHALQNDLFLVREITYDEHTWTMQLSSQLELLQQVTGEVYSRLCQNELGVLDGIRSFCPVNIEAHPFKVASAAIPATAFVASRRELFLEKSGGSGFTSSMTNNWFGFGRMHVLTGKNQGQVETIIFSSTSIADTHSFKLLRPMPYDFAIGDTADVYVGCDKSRPTCISKFGALQGIGQMGGFRGAPDMPGFDAVIRNPRGG